MLRTLSLRDARMLHVSRRVREVAGCLLREHVSNFVFKGRGLVYMMGGIALSVWLQRKSLQLPMAPFYPPPPCYLPPFKFMPICQNVKIIFCLIAPRSQMLTKFSPGFYSSD